MKQSVATVPVFLHAGQQGAPSEARDCSPFFPSAGETMAWIRWLQGNSSRKLAITRIQRILNDFLDLFRGSFQGYRPCDTRYHDEEHTLRLIPPFCQMAAALAKEHPKTISARDLELGIVAVLLHDTGYIRERDDCEGTGAKYTFRHIERSIVFSRTYLPSLGYSQQDILGVEQMIRCTGVKAELEQVCFSSQGFQLMGHALGTSDLLAQMADPHYLEKLPSLFLEFHEAYLYEGTEQLEAQGVQILKDADELIQKTPLFYCHVVLKRLEAMGSLYRLLKEPRSGRNPYLETIERHLDAISNM